MHNIVLNTPELQSVWKHYNGNEYVVVAIANENSLHDEYPATVVYKNRINGNVFTRALSDWHRSMTLLAEASGC